MYCRCVDERLIRRGELLLSLDFLESYDLELSIFALNPFCVGGCRVYLTAFMTIGDVV
jgi:hypothetical protein